MNQLKIALQILTVFPVPGPEKMELRYIGEGIRYFTLIGLGIGFILAALVYLGTKVLPLSVVCALLPLILAVIAGGSHMDGLMDTADGLGSRREREKMLMIMKDSRVGAYGVMFGASSFLLKYALLSALPVHLFYTAVILFPVFGRWAIAFSACLFPYARPDGLGKPFAEYSGWKEMLAATLVLLLPLFFLLHITGLLIWALVLLLLALFNCWLTKVLGGLTGDTYGAACEMSEIAFLLLTVAFFS